MQTCKRQIKKKYQNNFTPKKVKEGTELNGRSMNALKKKVRVKPIRGYTNYK